LEVYPKRIFKFGDSYLDVKLPFNKEVSASRNVEKLNKGVPPNTPQKILEAIRKNPSITRNELAEMLGLSPDSIKEQIGKLRKSGQIKRIGATKGGYWELIEE